MITKKLRVRLTFNRPLLGSANANPDVHAEFIAARAAKSVAKDGRSELQGIAKAAEENKVMEDRAKQLESLDHQDNGTLDPAEEAQKKMTIFPADENGIFVWDYQIKGYLKESLLSLIEYRHEASNGLSKYAYKSAVAVGVNVTPRRIYILNPADKPWIEAPRKLDRPLRADTMQGPRTALVSSQMVPEESSIVFTLSWHEPTPAPGQKVKSLSFGKLTEETIRACLDLGDWQGFGQWRSGGFGKFTWSEVSESGDELRLAEVQECEGVA